MSKGDINTNILKETCKDLKPLNITKKTDKKLNTNEAAMAFIVNMIGGGIVSLPFASINVGLEIGISIHIIIIVLYLLSTLLYIKAKDNLGYE